MDAQTLFSKSNLDKQRPFRGEVSADHVRRGIMSYRVDSETGAVRETVVHALPPNVNPVPPHTPMTFPNVRDAARIQELIETFHRAEHAPKPAPNPDKKEKIQVDKWGMVSSFPERKQPERSPEKLREREAKWLLMIANWDRFVHDHPAKLKSRCRKGVPDSLRGMVWARLTGAQNEMESKQNRGVYQDLLKQPLQEDVLLQIRKDIRRIFPKHVMFKNTSEQRGANGNEDSEFLYSPGQKMLSNVLKAFAVRNPHIGYCQSMGAPAATFLMYMPEELSFWTMECFLMKGEASHRFGNVYIEKFPLLRRLFYVFDALFRRLLPKLFAHFQANSILTSLYAVKWFQLIFSEFPRELVLAVWDVFFSEGLHVLLHVALGILSIREKHLLRVEGNDLMEQVRDLYQAPEFRDAQMVMDTSMKLDISKKELDKLEAAYLSLPPEEQEFG